MGKRLCMGLFDRFSISSPLVDRTHDGLPTGLDRHPLDPDHLRLTFAPVSVQGLE
jgi:hypothetical protein